MYLEEKIDANLIIVYTFSIVCRKLHINKYALMLYHLIYEEFPKKISFLH